MKKFMKNLMLVAVAAMGFTACSEVIDETVAPEKQTKTITVVSDITRTTLNNDRTELVWAEGDTFGAFTDAGDINIQPAEAYTVGAESFNLEVAAEATEIYAYYPYYEGNNSKTANEMSVGIQGTQYQNAAGVLASYMPMVARGTINDDNTVNLVFQPYGCVIAFNVYGGTSETEKVTSIKFTSNNQKSSGFTYTYDLTDENATFTPAYDYTLLNLNADAQFVPNGSKPADAEMFENAAYMVVAQAVYGAGVEIVVTTNEDTYTFTSTGDIDCSSCYKTMNLNLAKAAKASDAKATIAEGDYILAVQNGDKYIAVSSTLTTGSTKRLSPVDVTTSFNAEAMTVNDDTIVWGISTAEGGYYIKSGDMYMFAANSNSANLQSDPFVISILDNEDGTYQLVPVGDNLGGARSLALNISSDYFAFYKDTTVFGSYASGYCAGFYLVPATFVATPSIEVDKSEVSLGCAESTGTINVTTKYIDEAIEVTSSDESWLTGEIDGSTLTYSVAANSNAEERTATLTLSAEGASATVTFTQAAYTEAGDVISYTESFVNINYTGSDKTTAGSFTGDACSWSYVGASSIYWTNVSSGSNLDYGVTLLKPAAADGTYLLSEELGGGISTLTLSARSNNASTGVNIYIIDVDKSTTHLIGTLDTTAKKTDFSATYDLTSYNVTGQYQIKIANKSTAAYCCVGNLVWE